MTEFLLFRPHLRKQIAQTELWLPASGTGSTANRAAPAGLDLDPGRRQAPVTGLHWPSRRPSRLRSTKATKVGRC